MAVTVKKTGPGIGPLQEKLKRLKGAEVLVGIPAAKASRPGAINNAELAFVMENGSPIKNIPPRPFLKPSIQNSKKQFAPHLANAAEAILAGDTNLAEKELNKAGAIAANGAKRYILEGDNLTPDSPATIARKKSDRPLVDTSQLVRSIDYVVRLDGVVKPKREETEPERQQQRRPAEPAEEAADVTAEATSEAVEAVGEAVAEGAEVAGEVAGEVAEGAAELLL